MGQETKNKDNKEKRYKSTQYAGVRYREHKSRKHNGKPDRYFLIRYKNKGKSIEESVGWASARMNAQKANKLRAEITENIRLGRPPQSIREKRELEAKRREEEEQDRQRQEQEMVTFGELGEEYIKWAKGSKRSWRDDEQRYNSHLRPVLADKPLKEISSFDLEQLKAKLLKEKLAPATVKHCLVLIRQMYNKAVAWGWYTGDNPIKQVKLPTIKNKRHRFLSHEEADRLLEELKKSSLQVHDQALISLHCGLRFGEIAKLIWADLDFTHDIIQVRDPKGDNRQAFMTDEVKEALLARMPKRKKPTELVFKDRSGKKAQTGVSNAFDRTVKKLGFNEGVTDRRDRVVFHSLRHTFASWLAIQGESLLTIRELMGHKSIEMTMRYSHLIPDQKRKAVVKLAKNFDKARDSNGKKVDLEVVRD